MDRLNHLRTSVCIATHNRREDLRRTLRALSGLAPQPDEIMVCCDGCTDGTEEMLGMEFPGVVRLRHPRSLGSVASRDELLRATTGEVVLSFDDDSEPIENDYVSRVVALFAERPRLAIASFPQRSDEFPESLSVENFGPSRYVAFYAASAAAFRRSAYLELPGWDPRFGHAYEEPDLVLQALAAGWQVLHYTGVTVRHFYSPTNRDEMRMHHLHSRNEQWSVWMRCPFPQAIFVALFRVARQFGYAVKRGPAWVAREPVWWLGALRGAGHCLKNRRPVRWSAYRGWMRLFRHPVESEKPWELPFPP